MTKGLRIRIVREELNIPQTDLAKKVGISKQTLYKYENDIVTNIPSDKLELIAKELGVSPAYIMGWDDDIEITEAMATNEKYEQIIQAYAKATPEIQKAVELILKANQLDP